MTHEGYYWNEFVRVLTKKEEILLIRSLGEDSFKLLSKGDELFLTPAKRLQYFVFPSRLTKSASEYEDIRKG